MNRPTRPVVILFLLLFIPFFSSCGGGSAVQTDESPLFEQEGKFVDWDQVDWKFKRQPLAQAYLFDRLRTGDALRKYVEQTWYMAPLEALGLEEFQKLPPGMQEHRRKQAAEHHHEAMAMRRILNRGWEIWTRTLTFAVAEEAMIHEMGIITPAIKHLKMAAGLDPSDPFTWYDLAYFAGVVGDRKLQRESLANGLAALDISTQAETSPVWKGSEDLARLRLRILLDQAWSDRDEGFFKAGLAAAQTAIAQMAADDLRTLDEAREALLLQALLKVDLGDIYDARQLARKLPEWRLPIQKSPFYGGSAGPAMRKENLEHIESNFCHDWVWTMTFLKLGEKEQALARMRERNYLTEYPPHLNHRFWRDMGQVLEHFGERGDARLAYGFSIIYYPYFPYFPLQGARGISRVLDQTGAGQTYYLGFKNFFISGSYFSYAANRVVTLEMAADSTETSQRGEQALEALSTCIRRDIRPASARALRGRAHYRLGNQEEALADLEQAHDQLREDERESPEVVKLLAIIHFDREEFETTLTWLERYVDLKPDDGFGWRLSGQSLAHLGRFDEAAKVLDYALKLDPNSLTAWYNLALVHIQKGEVDQARTLLAEAETRFVGNENIARLQKLIREDPQAPIQLTSSKVQLRTTSTDSLWFARSNVTSGANMIAGMSRSDAESLLPRLWQRYRGNPDPENRLTLVRALAKAERSREIQDLLGPLWPDRLSRDEALQLLIADRDGQNRKRAVDSANTLRHDANPYPDSEFWALVALVCLENGAHEEGMRALGLARELDPDNVALQGIGQ